MQEITDLTSNEGWVEIPYKTHTRPTVPGLLYIPHQNSSYRPFNSYNHNNRNHYQNMAISRPISHYWNGFDILGNEKWMIEMENGSFISNKEHSYPHLVKKYFPNDIIR